MLGHSAGSHLLEDRQKVTRLGLEARSSLCLLPSLAELSILALRAGRADMPGTKHVHASFNRVTGSESIDHYPHLAKEAIMPGGGEQVLAELAPEQRLPDPRPCCPVPSRWQGQEDGSVGNKGHCGSGDPGSTS